MCSLVSIGTSINYLILKSNIFNTKIITVMANTSNLDNLRKQLNEAMAKKAELQFELSVNRQQQINPTDFNSSLSQNINAYRNYLRVREHSLEKKVIAMNTKINDLRKRISHYQNIEWRLRVDYYIHMEAVMKEMKKNFNVHEMNYLNYQKKAVEDYNKEQFLSLEPLPTYQGGR